MTVDGVVVCLETDFLQLNRIAMRVFAALGNVRAFADQDRILEKIIRSPILLEDHYHVLNLSRRRWRLRTATGRAAAVEAQESASHGQHHNCEQHDTKLNHCSYH